MKTVPYTCYPLDFNDRSKLVAQPTKKSLLTLPEEIQQEITRYVSRQPSSLALLARLSRSTYNLAVPYLNTSYLIDKIDKLFQLHIDERDAPFAEILQNIDLHIAHEADKAEAYAALADSICLLSNSEVRLDSFNELFNKTKTFSGANRTKVYAGLGRAINSIWDSNLKASFFDRLYMEAGKLEAPDRAIAYAALASAIPSLEGEAFKVSAFNDLFAQATELSSMHQAAVLSALSGAITRLADDQFKISAFDRLCAQAGELAGPDLASVLAALGARLSDLPSDYHAESMSKILPLLEKLAGSDRARVLAVLINESTQTSEGLDEVFSRLITMTKELTGADLTSVLVVLGEKIQDLPKDRQESVFNEIKLQTEKLDGADCARVVRQLAKEIGKLNEEESRKNTFDELCGRVITLAAPDKADALSALGACIGELAQRHWESAFEALQAQAADLPDSSKASVLSTLGNCINYLPEEKQGGKFARLCDESSHLNSDAQTSLLLGLVPAISTLSTKAQLSAFKIINDTGKCLSKTNAVAVLCTLAGSIRWLSQDDIKHDALRYFCEQPVTLDDTSVSALVNALNSNFQSKRSRSRRGFDPSILIEEFKSMALKRIDHDLNVDRLSNQKAIG